MLSNKGKEMKSQYIRTLYEFDNNNLDILISISTKMGKDKRMQVKFAFQVVLGANRD